MRADYFRQPVFVGAFAIIVAALLWSIDGTYFRPHLFSLPSALVVFLEHLLGFLALSPFLFIYRRELARISLNTWLAIFWVALFGGALGTTFFTKALFLTGFRDISVVILLQKFQPLFAIGLSALFLHERFPHRFYGYAALAMAAGYFVTFKNPFLLNNILHTIPTAALFALLAAFSWGSATAFGKFSLGHIHYRLLAALRFGLTALIMAFPTIYLYSHLFISVTPLQWHTLFIIVFSSGAAAMFLYYYGLVRIPASIATLCELAWPTSAIVFDYFVNHNVLSWSQLVGAAILIFAVTRATLLNRSYTITGTVLAGQNEGEKLGMKTANFDPALARQLPKGLYRAQAALNGRRIEALLYYGINSLTERDCLEVHLLQFEGNLYGATLTITTTAYLRAPKKFSSRENLAAQLERDRTLGNKITSSPEK